MSSLSNISFNPNSGVPGDLNPHDQDAARALADMRKSINPSYGPVRETVKRRYEPVPKNNSMPTKFTAELFSQIYRIGTKVRYKSQNYKIATEMNADGKVMIENGSSQWILPVSSLKPSLESGSDCLALGDAGQFRGHAILRIESIFNGIVCGKWKEFGEVKFNSMTQPPDALYRFIPLSLVTNLDEYNSKIISSKMSDETTQEGTVYYLQTVIPMAGPSDEKDMTDPSCG